MLYKVAWIKKFGGPTYDAITYQICEDHYYTGPDVVVVGSRLLWGRWALVTDSLVVRESSGSSAGALIEDERHRVASTKYFN